jgi:hypothetical protein
VPFGFVLVRVRVRQSRQRRDAAAAGEETLSRCTAGQSKYYRLYLYSGKIALAAIYLRRVRVAGRSFAAALTYVSRIVTPPASAVHDPGVGLRRPCQGKAFSGMLGAMVRTAAARPATPR